jgi:hypothetical protein
MDQTTQATTEPKDIGQILDGGRTQVAADVPAPAQEHQRDQTDASGPDDTGGDDRRTPLAALHKERARRKAAQERAAQLEVQLQEALAAQQPADEPDSDVENSFWMNPDKAMARNRAETNARISRAEFVAEHGKAAFKSLSDAVSQARASNHPDLQHLEAIVSKSPDPMGVVAEWATEALGWSPDQDDRQPHHGMVMPSNLAGARNVGNRSGPKWAGRPSIDDILKSAHQPRDIFKR